MNNEFLIFRQELWAVIPLAPSHLSTTQNLEDKTLDYKLCYVLNMETNYIVFKLLQQYLFVLNVE